MSTIRITLELSTADPDDDAAELWQDMKGDGPLTLLTRSWSADVKPLS